MPWERVGHYYINLPRGMWDDPVLEPTKVEPVEPIKKEPGILADVKLMETWSRQYRPPKQDDGQEPTERFIKYIEQHRPSLIRMHRGATWRSQLLTGGQVSTLKKHGILAKSREISPGRWVTELTPKAIAYLKLEGV